MLTCKDLVRLTSGGEIEEASWLRRFSLRLHLLMCRHCRRYLAQLTAIRRAVRNAPAEPEEADRIRRIEEKLLEGLSPGSVTPPGNRPT